MIYKKNKSKCRTSVTDTHFELSTEIFSVTIVGVPT